MSEHTLGKTTISATALLTLSACWSRPPTEPQTIVLLVMDTVRADHTSLCGYARPTTPWLASLPGAGWAHTCGMVTPAPWTIPSHATFFTGKDVAAHGARFNDDGKELRTNITVRPLDPSHETLAETLQAQGWQTVLVSANPVIQPESGLTQGFDVVKVSGEAEDGGKGRPLRGEALVNEVKRSLADLDDTRPLLLVVNLLDAHDPYPPIAADHPFLPRRERLPLQRKPEDTPYNRFHDGRMAEAERERYLAHATDTYDRGVEIVDRSLAAIWALLEDGWLDQGWRAVITADHGELLGEHDRMRHAGHLWEPLLRVPLVFRDSTAPLPDLSGTVSGVEVYTLLRQGRRPEVHPPALSFAEPAPAHAVPGIYGISLIDGAEKLWWVQGEPPQKVDLATHPGEDLMVPLGDDPRRAVLEQAMARQITDLARPGGAPTAEQSALRALGYIP